MQEKNRYFTHLMLLAMLLWGGGWPALKILTPFAPLDVVTFWRFAIMFFALIPVLVLARIPLVLPKKSLPFIFASAVLNILFMLVAFLGVQYGAAGSGGVIITTLSPLFTFMLVTLLFKNSLTKIQLLGLTLGVIGGMIMLEVYHASVHTFFNAGTFYYILAALFWALITLISQRSQLHIHPIHYSFSIAGLATLLLYLGSRHSDLMMVFDQGATFWAALLYLSILGQTLATTIYYVASGKLGSAKASSFMFVVPLSALIVSYVILDEAIKMPIVIGGGLSLIAVYFINKQVIKKL